LRGTACSEHVFEKQSLAQDLAQGCRWLKAANSFVSVWNKSFGYKKSGRNIFQPLFKMYFIT